MDVAVPPAVVMVAPALNDVVPVGANQIALDASPELTTVTLAPPSTASADANTVFWFVGAALSTVNPLELTAVPSTVPSYGVIVI